MGTKNEVFKSFLTEYLGASRQRKSEIINSVGLTLRMHRKSIIRGFRRHQLRDPDQPDRRGRKAVFTEEAISALETVWAVLSELCGELIHPMIKETVEILVAKQQWWHGRDATEKLLQMSLSSVKRFVGGFVKERKRKRSMGTTSPSHIKNIIPIFNGPWEGKPPGYGQIDTVVHCGNTLRGDMIFSVNFTDVCTGWVVLASQWNKSEEATVNSLKRMKTKTPFRIVGMHPDSGSEFVNFHLKRWCVEENIELTRSRPYHKNDNAYVEQKNGHVIRRFLGYDRLDKKEIVPLMNKLYDLMELYLNHFVPSRKCICKVRVGARYRRKYDTATTPYHRVMRSEMVPEEMKNRMKDVHKELDPLKLRNQIDKLISKIMRIQRTGNSPF